MCSQEAQVHVRRPGLKTRAPSLRETLQPVVSPAQSWGEWSMGARPKVSSAQSWGIGAHEGPRPQEAAP